MATHFLSFRIKPIISYQIVALYQEDSYGEFAFKSIFNTSPYIF